MQEVILVKDYRKIILGIIIGVILLCALPINVKASESTLVTLSAGKLYSGLDVTGDGKIDKVIIENQVLETYPERYVTSIYINKKEVLRLETKSKETYTVKICNAGNKNAYFSVEKSGRSTNFHKMYQYKNKKLMLVLNVEKIFGNSTLKNLSYTVKKVEDNKITLSFSGQVGFVGKCKWNVLLNAEKGKLKAQGKTFFVNNGKKLKPINWISTKPLIAYKKVNSSSKVFRIKVGDILKIDSLYISGKKTFMHTYNKAGLAGWIRVN